MLLRNSDLHKVRCGVFKCPTCGTFYDPTYGACPGCQPSKAQALAIVVMVLLALWVPVQARAQMAPPACVVNGGVVECNSVYLPIGVK